MSRENESRYGNKFILYGPRNFCLNFWSLIATKSNRDELLVCIHGNLLHYIIKVECITYVLQPPPTDYKLEMKKIN